MEGFEYRSIVVQLRERSIECHKKGVVDTWMAYVMTDCGDKKGESIEGFEN
jgi:hypothetical protein